MNGLFEGVDMAKVLMGQNAFHISLNLLAQSYRPEEIVSGFFQTQHGLPLLHGSDKPHVVILGDAIIRPRLVIETDGLQGSGANHLFMNGFLDAAELLRNSDAKVLL